MTAVERYIEAFEGLRPDTLDALLVLFDDQARFVDPFNDVRGQSAIRAVFSHMFEQCERPRFRVNEQLGDAGVWYLHWTFTFGRSGHERRIVGVSRVVFGPDGRVREHIDFWDPARQIYESIPLLGRLLRALRRRLGSARDEQSTTSPSDTSFATERK
jgi:steroid delta-isomerase